ncbi:hypothetical protein EV424DRAFT_248780 [Suillus variegatus]|nr:hypothetical protein EV424DRAFT_248780 [Suillus variegatus]
MPCRTPSQGNTPSNLDIIFQVNDHPIHQDHQDRTSKRKPDIVILPYACAFAGLPEENRDMGADDYKLISAATKPKKKLFWKDVLACVEFKRPTKKLSQCPLSYEVAPYKPTHPEYRRVEPPETDTPAIAAVDSAQTPATLPVPDAERPVRRSPRLAVSSQNPSNDSSKRKAAETLESASKRAKTDDDTEPDPEPKLDVTVQTGLYAAEMFAANVAVKHLVNLVVDEMVWVWHYDRQGTIQCSGINFIQDLPRFMVLLYAFQRFSLVHWGRNADFKHDEKNDSHKLMIDGVDLELHTSHKDRVAHYGLKGRATNVFPVTSAKLSKDNPEIAKDGMVAKVFWAEEQRASEPDILKKVYEIAEEQDAVKGHVPHLLWHHKFKDPTSKIREALGVSEPAKGSRVLYILVFCKLKPITELKGTEFFDAWRQCIMCHYALWQAGVYHRDVSPGNMMWYRNGTVLMGVLNDYDLSSLATALGPQGNERTGTIPFMALDLLSKKGQRGEVKHLYRHDLESFVWVLVWVSLRYKDGRLLSRKFRPFDEWATVDAETCGEKKSFFQTNFLQYEFFAVDQRMWELVMDCLQLLKADAYRRETIGYKIRRQAGVGRLIMAEEFELDDLKFLDLFTHTEAWVQLSNSVQ